MGLLAAAVLTMSASQLFDLATFIEMVRRAGPAAEANPLIGLLLGFYGVPMVATAKVALIAFLSAIAADLSRRPAGMPVVRFVLGAGTLAGLVGGVSNSLVIGIL